MQIVCLDLEGVLIPEIWVAFSEKTGVSDLTRTTRDEPDYQKLMLYRLDILERHGFTLKQIQDLVEDLEPLPGALQFLDEVRKHFEVILLSDTFREFSGPLIKKLNFPTLFCHELEVREGHIVDVRLRLPDHKRKTVQYLQKLNFKVVAAGDSYNDMGMLKTADFCMLFNPPEQLVQEYPDISVAREYDHLLSFIKNPK